MLLIGSTSSMAGKRAARGAVEPMVGQGGGGGGGRGPGGPATPAPQYPGYYVLSLPPSLPPLPLFSSPYFGPEITERIETTDRSTHSGKNTGTLHRCRSRERKSKKESPSSGHSLLR